MPRYTAENTKGCDVRVFVDGEEVEGVLEADDDLGFVVRRTKEPGRFRELLVGIVTVDLKRRDG